MSCPYAFSKKLDDDQSNQSHTSPIASSPPSSSLYDTNNPNLQAMQALQLAKSSCPAFQSSCPFRDVQDAYSMKKALKNMPSSHYESIQQSNSNNGDNPKTIISEMQEMSRNRGGSTTNTTTTNVFGNAHNVVVDTNVSEARVLHPRTNSKQQSEESSQQQQQQQQQQQPIEISQSLRIALQHVHTISQSIDLNASHVSLASSITSNTTTTSNEDSEIDNSKDSLRRYSIAGGICPYKTINNTNSSSTNTSILLEELSFSALLAKLIHSRDSSPSPPPSPKLSSFLSSVSSSTTSTTTTTPISDSTPTNVSSTLKKSKSSTSLSTALKVGTAKSHSSAESVHFVKEFIKGNIDRTLYSNLIANLYWVYKTLEEELDIYAPIQFPTLHKRELYRMKSLQDDLEFFYSGLDFDDERNDEDFVLRKIPPSQATKDYIHRLKFIAKEEPLLLLSHAYTRYLGDLSGGKVLARVAKRALNLKGEPSNRNSNSSSNSNDVIDGLSFYHFPEIKSAKIFKDEYRHALDNLDELTDEHTERLVAEANVAFVLNMRIFEELDVLGGVKGSSVRAYKDATCYYEECIDQQAKRKDANGIAPSPESGEGMDQSEEEFECPFAKLGGPNPHQHVDSSHHATPLKDDAKGSQSAGPGTTEANLEKRRCPWPFVFLHDPRTGLLDWQTWFVAGLVLCICWEKVGSL